MKESCTRTSSVDSYTQFQRNVFEYQFVNANRNHVPFSFETLECHRQSKYTNETQRCLEIFKGVVDWFFSRLDFVYGVQSSMWSCLVFLKRIIFHIIYLYSTPLCPFSDKRLNLFPGFMKLLLQKYAMGWDWLAGSVCCDSLNRLYWTSRPSPQWHVLRLNCKQWCCL